MTFTVLESPFEVFAQWYQSAAETEPDAHDAMALATVDAAGQPSVRIVLLKAYDERGFTFFTNTRSQKGQDLASNARAGLNFYWKSSDRQIRIEGHVQLVTPEDADAYFASRNRGSQIGAWASQQSEVLVNGREDLLQAVATYEAAYAGGAVPRPDHWSGYRLVPHRLEFWQGAEDRLHHRGVYERTAEPDQGWQWSWLNP